MLDFTGSFIYQISTTPVYRDPSAWYHIVWTKDTTQATDTNRMKLYVNGVQVTTFNTASYPTLNSESYINNNVAHHLGTTETTDLFFNGYMTEVNFIDGQALTPSSFGQTHPDTGVWQPKRYAGSYGTNGFYLNFSDNSNTTAATLGADYSGNGNNWTPNNFSVSAGVGNDSLVDVPTNWGVDTGVGGTVRGNYATLNPLQSALTTLSNGNLDFSATANGATVVGTMAIPLSGKWYFECTPTNLPGSTSQHIGVQATNVLGVTAENRLILRSDGVVFNTAGIVATIAGYSANDVVGVALDSAAETIQFYKNGSANGSTFSVTNLSAGNHKAYNLLDNLAAGNFNFGQRPFAYTAPSGFKALNTQNLPTPTIGATPATQAGKFFNPVLYTGTGSNLPVTVGFQPDMIWTKARSAVDNNVVVDVLRGIGNILVTNNTNAESAYGAFVSFDSNGFTKAALESVSGRTYVAWNWKANGAGVTNTAGSITSTVSANTTSGFSVVTWTGNGTNGATIGHGLGTAPVFTIVKSRSGVNAWYVWSQSLSGNTYGLSLNTTDSQGVFTFGNFGTKTSTTIELVTGSNGADNVNLSGRTYVAYCFAEVPGYSKFGSYTGNGSADGPFCFTGMRPAYVMYKKAGGPDGDWVVLDVKRDPTNVTARYLAPNASQAESNDPPFIDILSNGFKMRRASGGSNESGVLYIFAAFAEFPFKYSLAR
jgi:hypothetical protein